MIQIAGQRDPRAVTIKLPHHVAELDHAFVPVRGAA